MFDYILYDFDGTVFDTVEGITRSVRYAINKQGLDAELSELRCFAGPPLEDMFMEKFGFTRERAKQATVDFRERYLPIGLYECRVFPGIKEHLAAMRAAGKRLAVATSKPQPLAEKLLAREDMSGLFDAVCGSALQGNNNAKWQVVQRAMEALGAAPARSILVGDTKYDVTGAHQCGLPCVCVAYGYAAPGELEAAGADRIVPDLEALGAFLVGEG